MVRGFPYVILFEHGDGVTTVLSVVHAASDPTKWGHRK